jgi:flagellar motility protein MotE (MotC chaperone)
MTRIWRDVRLIPVVLVATISLFVLKVSGLVFDGGYTLADRMAARHSPLQITSADSVPDQPKITVAGAENNAKPAEAKAWAKEMFNFNADPADVTGSVGGNEGAPPPAKNTGVSNQPPPPTKIESGGAAAPLPTGQTMASAGERAVLESLQDRRRQLEKRARELDMRENLLKAAEKRLDAKLEELKSMEAKVDGAASARGKAEAQQLKGIVSMYENMKPKDAARIFDRLDVSILLEVTSQMNPRKMSEVLAQMSPDAAERLTVEIARRATAGAQPSVDALPKIEGKPRS